MLVRPIHHEAEFGKWLAILALAAALCVLFASALAADSLTYQRPRLLTPDAQLEAVPMARVSGPANPERGEDLWRILQLHHDRQHRAAIEGWNRLPVPEGARIWKWIATGQALTALSEFADAEQLLGQATAAQPDHAIAHYFTGVLRMQQAYLADEWPDVVPRTAIRLAAVHGRGTGPRWVVPNTKGMYELAATRELELALEFASGVPWGDPLLPNEGGLMQTGAPTVGDLLLALGAEQFEAKAHNTLSYLFLERGALEIAEQHMDQAVHGGLPVVYGYRDLGDEYAVRGQHADAARAYFKAARFTSEKLDTLRDAWKALGRALVTP